VDLVIRGGTLLTPAGRVAADLGVRGEEIAQIGGVMTGAREISAKGRLVLPGGFDPHVHLTTPRENEEDSEVWVDNLQSGSEAAFAGGLTSVGNMSFVMPVELPSVRLAKEVAELAETGMADMVFHPVVLTPNEANIADVVTQIEMGVSSVKFFMSFPTFDSLAKQYGLLMRAAADAGALTMIHCEDAATIECCNGMLKKHGHNSLRHFAQSRPIPAETIATDRAIAMCEATGAPTYIVHLSSKKALESCAAARKRGLPIFVETRPLYLHMTAERYQQSDGPLFVAQPPLRNSEDVAALWRGLADGTIDTMGSDHAPWTRTEKMNPALNLDNLRPGVSDLETMLPMLFSEGVLKERISLERFVQLTSETPAKLFGLYPRKGAIAVGSDADLAIWETGGTKVIHGAQMYSRAGHSVYEGTELHAWPSLVVRRGQVVYENEVVIAKPGSGKWLLAPR
jgi:dihydropyrimidinase